MSDARVHKLRAGHRQPGTLTTLAAVLAFCTAFASTAAAQAAGSTRQSEEDRPRTSLTSVEGTYFINLSMGVQPQERTFDTSSTFVSFGENGTAETSQNIARATFLDLTGGYQFTNRLGFAIGIWAARADSAVSAAAALPDSTLFNRFQNVAFTADDLSQTTLGFNLQLLFRQPLGDRLDVTVSLGPTLLVVRQQVGVVTVTPNTLNAVLESITQSKTSLKGGHAGLEIGVRLSEVFGVGVFGRYAGGEVDLPSAPKLKVGGMQVGGGLRFRF